LGEAGINTVVLSDSARGIRAGAALLRQGGLVAFPTETVYGLGADATDDRAVARIFAAKGRPSFNPLIAHVASAEAAAALAEMPEAARLLAEAFWPGPLTLVLRRGPDARLSELVTAGLPTVAVRVPAHPLAAALIAAFGGPVAAPSANLSGRVSPTTREHVLDGLGGRIEAVFEGGACPVGLESAIVAVGDAALTLLRPGAVSVEALVAASGLPVRAAASDAPILAPGGLASHYAPRAALRLDADGPRRDEAWLGFGPVESLQPSLNLSPAGDLEEAAANLFAHLRALDALAAEAGLARIAVASIPAVGIGIAINDRLARAAAPREVEPG
jgi:L-threonylcarbamoyladenylate synthase